MNEEINPSEDTQKAPEPTPTLPATETRAAEQTQSRPPKETFSKEYVAELRAENDGWQKRHKKAAEQLDKLKQETQQRLTQTQQAARERIIRAEMKALALKAGLRDLDCLKLADTSKVTLNEDDTLAGAEDALAALKASKPFLFGESVSHSSQPESSPTPKSAEPTDVSRLPLDEYEQSKATYLRTVSQKSA
jgi:hypothetical protein